MAHGNLSLLQILDTQRIPKRARQLLELQDFARIRLFVNAMQRRNPALEQIPRHRAVRRQHELLDQAVRDVALAARDVDHALLLVELDYGLRQIEINRAMLVAPGVQQQRELFHIAKMVR